MRNVVSYLTVLSLALVGPGTSPFIPFQQTEQRDSEELSSPVLPNELRLTEKRFLLPDEDTLTLEEEKVLLIKNANAKKKKQDKPVVKKKLLKKFKKKFLKAKVKLHREKYIRKKYVRKRPTVKYAHSKNTYRKSSSRLADIVVAEALKHIGPNYQFGAAGPKKFDCSGFTQYIYRKVGVSLPRTSRAQAQVGKPVSFGNLRKGDLVYFGNGISHVGIYMGDGKFISALNQKKGILIQDINISYWKKHFVVGRRVLN